MPCLASTSIAPPITPSCPDQQSYDGLTYSITACQRFSVPAFQQSRSGPIVLIMLDPSRARFGSGRPGNVYTALDVYRPTV